MAHEGSIEIRLRTVEGLKFNDPKTRIRFCRRSDNRTILRADNFTSDGRINLPAFPLENFMYFEVTTSSFRIYRSRSFLVNDGQSVELEDGLIRDGLITLLRSPKKSQAKFDLWNSLSAMFDPLKSVLESSPDIVVNGKLFPKLTEAAYDSIEGRSDTKQVNAKAAMLNLFARLTELGVPSGIKPNWFSFIQQLVTIGRERLIALVDDRMYDSIKDLRKNEPEGWKKASSGLHFKNFPAKFEVDRDSMISVKSDHDKANLQLTVARAANGGVLLDADIDENGNLLRHFGDLLRHRFTGGTRPFDIHEYLILQRPSLVLGYSLAART